MYFKCYTHNAFLCFVYNLSFLHNDFSFNLFLEQENYDEYDNYNDIHDMNEYALMEKFAEENVDEMMFEDDKIWDSEKQFTYDGTHFVRKCKTFLGISFCYCKSGNMPLPWPCFGLPKQNKNKKQVKVKVNANTDNDQDMEIKVSVKHYPKKDEIKTKSKTNDALQSEYNEYYYDNEYNQKVDRAYFENDANWNFVTSSSSYGSQENDAIYHANAYHVTKKCKQMSGSWNCFCQGFDKIVFECNSNAYQIGNGYQIGIIIDIHRNFYCRFCFRV